MDLILVLCVASLGCLGPKERNPRKRLIAAGHMIICCLVESTLHWICWQFYKLLNAVEKTQSVPLTPFFLTDELEAQCATKLFSLDKMMNVNCRIWFRLIASASSLQNHPVPRLCNTWQVWREQCMCLLHKSYRKTCSSFFPFTYIMHCMFADWPFLQP